MKATHFHTFFSQSHSPGIVWPSQSGACWAEGAQGTQQNSGHLRMGLTIQRERFGISVWKITRLDGRGKSPGHRTPSLKPGKDELTHAFPGALVSRSVTLGRVPETPVSSTVTPLWEHRECGSEQVAFQECTGAHLISVIKKNSVRPASQGGGSWGYGIPGGRASGALHHPESVASDQRQCMALLCPVNTEQFLSLSLLFFLYHFAALTDTHLAPTPKLHPNSLSRRI